MLRFEIHEVGRAPLPAIDHDERQATITIGSDERAQVRLPAKAARGEHVRIEAGAWVAIAAVTVDGKRREAGERGPIGDGIAIELDGYRVRVAPAPPGVAASPPQRTASLARELVRGLLGSGAAPSLEVERGPLVGARRELAPPEATLVIGRGDEAGWVILDDDLSRAHLEVRRGWNGITLCDLDSKNGTSIDGARIDREVELHDGQLIEVGNVAIRFRDPAERHLRGAARAVAPVATLPGPRPSPWPFVIAAAIAGLAVVGLAWILAS